MEIEAFVNIKPEEISDVKRIVLHIGKNCYNIIPLADGFELTYDSEVAIIPKYEKHILIMQTKL